LDATELPRPLIKCLSGGTPAARSDQAWAISLLTTGLMVRGCHSKDCVVVIWLPRTSCPGTCCAPNQPACCWVTCTQQDSQDVRLYRRRYIPELIMSLTTSPCAMSALTLSSTATAAAMPGGQPHSAAGRGSAGTNVLQGMQGSTPAHGLTEGRGPVVLNGAAAMGLALIARAASVPGLARHLVHSTGEFVM
jgi:hypothetical protein